MICKKQNSKKSALKLLTVKKILLLNPPGDKNYIRDYYCSHVSRGGYYWPPYDLLVLSGRLKGKYDITVIDAIVLKLKQDKCIKEILKINPDVIIFLTSPLSWENDFFLFQILKQNNKDLILIAGGDVYLNFGKMLMKQYTFLDAIILDFISCKILSFLDNIITFPVRGMITRNYINVPFDIKESNSNKKYFKLPVSNHELFPLKKYSMPFIRYQPFTCLSTTFGCPFNCRFCSFEKIVFRLRELNNIIDELQFIYKIGIREIYFRDLSFGANRRHTINLCKKMIQNNFNFSWSCEIRIDNIGYELLLLMKNAGCHTIMVGVETPNENILNKYQKGITKAQIINAFKIVKEVGIDTLAYFMIGLPGETEQSQDELINFAIKLDPEYAAFTITEPRLNTSMRDEVIREGWFHDSKIDQYSMTLPPQKNLKIETVYLSKMQVRKYYYKAVFKFYFRFSYLIKFFKFHTTTHLLLKIKESFHVFFNLFKKI